MGNGYYAHSFIVQLIRAAEHIVPRLVLKRVYAALAVDKAATVKHLLDRALGHHLRLSGLVLHDNSHAAAFEVEGDFVNLCIAVNYILRALFVLLIDDRDIDEIPEPGLKKTVEERVAEHSVVLLAVDVQVVFEHDLVLGERAGFVGAEYVDRAEVLDGVQVLDDDLLLAHRERAAGERRRHDHREHLRRHADRDRYSEQQSLRPVALGEPVDEQHDRNHDEHEADEYPRDSPDALFECGLRRFRPDALRDGAEHCVVSGCEHYSFSTADDDV